MKKILFILLLPMLFAFSSCKENNQFLVFKKKIRYCVSGTASDILITYANENSSNKLEEVKIADIPWYYTFKAKSETFVYLQAKNRTSNGSVKVEIFQNDKLLYSDLNERPFGSASCSGNIK